jgi:hypothetical protein
MHNLTLFTLQICSEECNLFSSIQSLLWTHVHVLIAQPKVRQCWYDNREESSLCGVWVPTWDTIEAKWNKTKSTPCSVSAVIANWWKRGSFYWLITKVIFDYLPKWLLNCENFFDGAQHEHVSIREELCDVRQISFGAGHYHFYTTEINVSINYVLWSCNRYLTCTKKIKFSTALGSFIRKQQSMPLQSEGRLYFHLWKLLLSLQNRSSFVIQIISRMSKTVM